MLVVAGGLVVGSGAVFSSQTSNPSNTFATGILSQSNSKANSAVLSVGQIIPGSSTSHESSGTVDIQNTGTVGGVTERGYRTAFQGSVRKSEIQTIFRGTGEMVRKDLDDL